MRLEPFKQELKLFSQRLQVIDLYKGKDMLPQNKMVKLLILSIIFLDPAQYLLKVIALDPVKQLLAFLLKSNYLPDLLILYEDGVPHVYLDIFECLELFMAPLLANHLRVKHYLLDEL